MAWSMEADELVIWGGDGGLRERGGRKKSMQRAVYLEKLRGGTTNRCLAELWTKPTGKEKKRNTTPEQRYKEIKGAWGGGGAGGKQIPARKFKLER